MNILISILAISTFVWALTGFILKTLLQDGFVKIPAWVKQLIAFIVAGGLCILINANILGAIATYLGANLAVHVSPIIGNLVTALLIAAASGFIQDLAQGKLPNLAPTAAADPNATQPATSPKPQISIQRSRRLW